MNETERQALEDRIRQLETDNAALRAKESFDVSLKGLLSAIGRGWIALCAISGIAAMFLLYWIIVLLVASWLFEPSLLVAFGSLVVAGLWMWLNLYLERH